MDFQCNVCGTAVKGCPIEQLDREISSCPTCRSSVRVRSMIHLLSMALFGRSMPIPEFPNSPEILGIGLSDGLFYASPLAAKLGYTNTFFHQEPFFDICSPVGDRASSCDFLISTEVFEHVVPPTQIAFQNAFNVLKPGGALILTVPFTNNEETVEHFPELHDYRILQFEDDYVLLNRTADGRYILHHDLVFHGGPGTTVEMRVYSRQALEGHLAKAGFVDVQIFDQDVPEWGIVHKYPWSLPILARRADTHQRSPGPIVEQSRAALSPPPAPEANGAVPPVERTTTTPWRDLSVLAFLACTVLGLFGLVRSNLLAEVLWLPSLMQQTLILFAGVGALATIACLAAVRSGWKSELLLGTVLALVAAVLCGPTSTALVLVFLLSSWCLAATLYARLGSRPGDLPATVTIVSGWSIFTLAFAFLAFLPVNTTATHTILLAAPIAAAICQRQLRDTLRTQLTDLFGASPAAPRPSRAYLAGLTFSVVVLSLHLAMVGLPERYFDAMAMHLYIPSFISAHRVWSYDANNYAFAYTPIGADMLYTHMFLLEGEMAARLLNFAAFLLTCIVTFQIAIRCCSRTAAIWAVALLVSVPLTLIESATLFTENTIALFVTTAVLVLIGANFRVRLTEYLAIIILVAGASVVKLHGAIFAGLFGLLCAVLLLRDARTPRIWVRLASITIAGGLTASWPYLYAWAKTGNPVLPLFNNIFKSPYFTPVAFSDSRWIGKLSPSFLYDATFASSGLVEGYNGAIGFTLFVFLAAGIFAALQRRNAVALFCGALGLFLIVAFAAQTQYLRYLLIFVPLLMVAVAFGIGHLQQIRIMRLPLAIVVGAVALLNVYKMPAGGWILGVSDLRACCSENLRRQLELGQAPERVANRVLNDIAGPMARVLYVSNPFGALLTGTAIYSAWYNTKFSGEFASAASEADFEALLKKVAPTQIVIDTTAVTPLDKLAAAYLEKKATLLTRVGRLALYQLQDSASGR